jgi:F-type H+-transporting ATPase subunit a
MVLLVAFAALAGRAIKKANEDEAPGTFLNIVELIIEFLDGVVNSVMGKNATKFVNYILTLFFFIFISNISGLLGLRPPTADYGVTFPLGVITFSLITFNKFKHQKVSGVIKGLCDPWVFWLPINLIGDFAVPVSLSLRLFANVLSGTVMMALYYGLLPIFVKIGIPAVLHIYFDLFSGAIQTYVFCMLTMTYVTDAIGDN